MPCLHARASESLLERFGLRRLPLKLHHSTLNSATMEETTPYQNSLADTGVVEDDEVEGAQDYIDAPNSSAHRRGYQACTACRKRKVGNASVSRPLPCSTADV